MELAVTHLAGVALALFVAFTFALYYLCVRLGTVDGRVYDLMLVTLVTNLVMYIPAVAVFHGIPTLTWRAVAAFAAAGVAGSLLARLVVIQSVKAIGASRTSPIVAANVFIASLLAIIFFDEQLTVMHLIGIVLIVAGIAVITFETARGSSPDASVREVGAMLVLPILGALLIGFEPIFITLGLQEGVGVLPGVAIKATAATLGFVGYLAAIGELHTRRFTFDRTMGWFVGAGVTSGIGIIGLFAALEIAPVVIVIPILQTSPLIVVVLSMLFLPRRLELVTLRLIIAALVVVIGATLVSVFG